LISSKSVTTLAPVVVNHALEVRVERMRELVASLEQVGDAGEAGREQPDERDDEESLPDPHAPRRRRRRPLEREAEAARDGARDEEREDRLAVAERERDREGRGEPEVLSERPDEVEDRRNVDRQPARAADPRGGLGQLREPRRPMGRSAPR
jgi:hypothetical protein